MDNFNLLKQLRQTKDFSQEDVARRVDISLRQYQNIESGKSAPNIYLGLRIARLFVIDPYQLWNCDNEIIGK